MPAEPYSISDPSGQRAWRSGHTAECTAQTAKYWQLDAEYRAKWPNHCTHCLGYGGHYYPDTRYEPGGFEPCDYCYGIGICPRCAQPMGPVGVDSYDWVEDHSNCTRCGWSDQPGDGALDPANLCWGCA